MSNGRRLCRRLKDAGVAGVRAAVIVAGIVSSSAEPTNASSSSPRLTKVDLSQSNPHGLFGRSLFRPYSDGGGPDVGPQGFQVEGYVGPQPGPQGPPGETGPQGP